ncbi:unnamed protein product [Caenorhabditis brenneri]
MASAPGAPPPAPRSQVAGGPSQLAPENGSKVGEGGGSEKSQMIVESIYGNVKPPKMTGTAGPRVTPIIEKLRKKANFDFWCGVGGVFLSLGLFSIFLFLFMKALKEEPLFVTIPDIRHWSRKALLKKNETTD